MKATFDIPDSLYRVAKARSALEGRSLRSVAIELLQGWANTTPRSPESPAAQAGTNASAPTRFDNAPWLAITRPYVAARAGNPAPDARSAAAALWGQTASAKAGRSPR